MTSVIQVFSCASGVCPAQTSSALNLIYILKTVQGKLDRSNLHLLVTQTRLPLLAFCRLSCSVARLFIVLFLSHVNSAVYGFSKDTLNKTANDPFSLPLERANCVTGSFSCCASTTPT